MEEFERTGLAIKNERGSFFDRFRGRIMFPVFDLNSQVVGFGGRVFKEKDNKEVAKYMNITNTPLYDKSRVLYGLDKAKVEVRKREKCILVEGYVDAIMCHQAGFENTVATSGTALTPYQLKILKRYTENLLTSFDMDLAGDAATKRGIDLAQLLGFNVKVITVSGEKDPADLISKDSKEWEKCVDSAKSILDFYFETAFSHFDKKTPEGKKAISKILLPVIKRIPNQIEKSHWVQELSKKISVREEDVMGELKKVKLEEDIYGLEKEELASLPQKSRKELLEERMMIAMLNFPENCIALVSVEDAKIFSPKISELFSFLKKEGLKPDNSSLPSGLKDLFDYFLLKAEIELDAGTTKEDMEGEMKDCLKNIRGLGIRGKLDEISLSLKSAEGEKNPEKIKELMERFNGLSKGLNDD